MARTFSRIWDALVAYALAIRVIVTEDRTGKSLTEPRTFDPRPAERGVRTRG